MTKPSNFCYAKNELKPIKECVIIIKRGETGYWSSDLIIPDDYTMEHIDKLIKELNDDLGVTEEEAEAMLVGSMFGWDAPGAQIENTNKLVVIEGEVILHQINDIITPQTKFIQTDRITVVDQELNMKLGHVVEINLKTRKVKQLKDGVVTEYPNVVRFELF